MRDYDMRVGVSLLSRCVMRACASIDERVC